MRIGIELAFDEKAAVRLLNWLARENMRILRSHRDLPNLYDAGVFYQREREETWSDVINLYLQGHEDCDALAAARAGELLARGYKALSVSRGDHGAQEARDRRLRSIEARVIMRTKTRLDEPGLFHCLVKYRVGSRWYYDDPSVRLGMRGYVSLRQPYIPPIPRRKAA